MTTLPRRVFLKRSLTFAGASVLPATSCARVVGANGDIRVAVAGFRRQGSRHIQIFDAMKGVRVVALCDPDRQVLERETARFRDKGRPVAAYTDIRKLLEDDSIDAISTASPHHWHALMTVWACQAGKDVYVEKIASHSVWEGRKMVEAARKYGRIVQVGTQKRSDPGVAEAVRWLHEGNLGKILLARGFCYKRRGSIGKVTTPQGVSERIDHDLWTGPAPLRPLMRRHLHYDWHWFWDTGNGDLGNQGIHEMDICRWFSGATEGPPRVISVGGRFGYDDDGETPNTEFAFHDYADIPVLFEVRGLPMRPGSRAMPHYKGIRVGNVIDCEGGYFAGGWAYDNKGKKIRSFKRDGGGSHFANFIKAVRSRKPSDLNAEILQGHLSAILCHTGSISHRLGQESTPEGVLERIQSHPPAAESFERMKQHLTANAVDLGKTPPVVGAWLQFDPKKELFVGPCASEANAMIRHEYREPFVVPENV